VNTVRATRDDVGRSYEDLHVHVYRFRHGRIIEFWGMAHDPQANASFWAQGAGSCPPDAAAGEERRWFA
jgi:hypothetical protein